MVHRFQIHSPSEDMRTRGAERNIRVPPASQMGVSERNVYQKGGARNAAVNDWRADQRNRNM